MTAKAGAAAMNWAVEQQEEMSQHSDRASLHLPTGNAHSPSLSANNLEYAPTDR
jgi:hypothetical protein